MNTLPSSKTEWILCVAAIVAIGLAVYHAALIAAAMMGWGRPLILFDERGYWTAAALTIVVGLALMFLWAQKE